MDNRGEPGPQSQADLRRIAEGIVKRRPARFADAEEKEVERLVHELEVHQVELEMQNAELRRTQHELESSRDRYADLYDFAPVGYVTLDRDARVQEINLTGASLLRIERRYLLGKTLALYVAVDHHGRFLQHIRTCIDEEQEAACEVTLVRPDRTRFAARLHSSPSPAAEGSVCRMILTDVTAEQKAAEELRQAKKTAEDASRAKGQFLANMSHELRTPMAAILGMVELVLDEDLTPSVRDSLQTAKDSADHLLKLLNELLDFSRIAAQRFELERLPFRLRCAVQEAVGLLRGQAEKKGLDLSYHLDDDVPDRVIGDVMRFRQVLMNLIGNAIKFTAAGRVEVHGHVASRYGSEAELRFAVIDTGIGISPEDQQRIFAPFTQADPSFHRKFGGSGLGLAITASLVGLMGGRIGVESRPGQGSTFWFTCRLPLQPAELAGAPEEPLCGGKPAEPPPASFTRLRVLVAEDTPANQKLLVRILQKRGHEVEVANNGREALERIAQGAFDVVLMDVQMPEIDGFEATALIRARTPDGQARLPIIAMTAHAMPGDCERCLSAGMDDYLTKPIDQRALIETVESRARRTGL